MDLAALNGHLPILTWLHTNKAGGSGGAQDLAARLGGICQGHDGVLKWLYHHTASRCSAVATMVAAGRGDIAMLKWLCQQGVTCSKLASEWAFAWAITKTLVGWGQVAWDRAMCDDNSARPI
eukprot:gene1201-32543_t